MDEKGPRFFTEEEIEKLKELAKDCMRYSTNHTDFLDYNDNVSSED